MYEATVKFVELGDRYKLPVRGTREYKELQTRISRALQGTEIARVPGFEEVTVTKFKRYVVYYSMRFEKMSK